MAPSAVTSDNNLIVALGEVVVDFIPTVSGVSLAEAPGFVKSPGGGPANMAVAAARLGAKVSFIGKLGDDMFGHMLLEMLEQNQVSGEGILFDPEARTALSFVTLRADGEREFMIYCNPKTDLRLKPEELNLDLLRSAKVLHYGSVSLMLEPCRSAHLKAMEVAKESGALLSYDPNLRLSIWPSPEEARKRILSVWDKADIIKISDDELEFLTGCDKTDDETAMKLWHPNLTLLLVTLGAKGSRYYTKNFHGAVDSYRVKSVDATGAGDSFVGALLCKIVQDPTILENESKLREVLNFANACGAITTTKRGAILALPTEAEILALINATKSQQVVRHL
ncbi:hypothetical protein V6N13_083268 [Hibiscus sabdariffa]|uniref:fructokinase n=1 Tax=Hibiscus sabdariffa TaxID=183260 RepID=A0ABR2SXN7_9ROSI